MMQGCEGIGG